MAESEEARGLVLAAKALSAPVSKLIDAVSRGVGQLYLPTHVRRMAAAEADAENIKRLSILDLPPEEIRALQRLILTETKRQKNFDRIIGIALRQLPATASAVPLDEDWTREFFNCCQDCSNEKIQLVWAKLLRDEIDRPGSFSRRTLNTLRLLTSEEAQAFVRFSCRVCHIADSPTEKVGLVMCDPGAPLAVAPDEEVVLRDSALLTSAGLVSAEQVLCIARVGSWTLSYGNESYRLRPTERDVEITVQRLTPIGEELYPVAFSNASKSFAAKLRRYFTRLGIEVSNLLSDEERRRVAVVKRW